MVAMFEIVFLIACAVLALWWFRRTSVYRFRMKSESEPGTRALHLKRQLDRQRKSAVRDDNVPHIPTSYWGG
jgi:hypothetical protein